MAQEYCPIDAARLLCLMTKLPELRVLAEKIRCNSRIFGPLVNQERISFTSTSAMMPLVASLTLWAIVVSTSPVDPADEALVIEYVKAQGNKTFREPSGWHNVKYPCVFVDLLRVALVSTTLGNLKYPYLVPAGYYQQLWDWDSMQTGTALLSMGSAPYLAGSMKVRALSLRCRSTELAAV